MANIDYAELIGAIEELEKQKHLAKGYLIEALETALVSAYKKDLEVQGNLKVKIDTELRNN
jgi:N utilization substance protein A